MSPSFKRGAAVFEEAAGLLFKHDAAIDDNVFVGDIELGDAAVDLSADELFHLHGIFGAAAAGRHEGAHADIDAESALDDFGDGADDGGLFGEGGFERGPVARLGNFEARELVITLFVATGNGDGEGVAGLDAGGVVFERRARQDAFSLVTDIDEDLLGGEGDDGAQQLLLAGLGLMGVGGLEGLEEGTEVFYRVFGGGRRRRRFNRNGGLRRGRRFPQGLQGLGDDGRIRIGGGFGSGFSRAFGGWHGLFGDGIGHIGLPLHSPTICRATPGRVEVLTAFSCIAPM